MNRPRRNRRSETVRRAFSETYLHPGNFILPVFVHDGEASIPIDSMPCVSRLGLRHVHDSSQTLFGFGNLV